MNDDRSGSGGRPRRVLVGYDGEPESEDALALATLLADALGAETVACFARAYEPAARLDERAYAEAWERHVERVLAVVEEELGERPHRVRGVRGEAPAAALAAAAGEEEADLIVVGSTRRGTLGRVFPGSTATGLFATAACPVAVAPRGFAADPGSPPQVIGVGYREEYTDSHHALEAARELAGELGAELRVIDVDAAPDEAVAQLTAAAERLDLLFLGSRRFPAPWAALVSSVSSRIATAPPCPLIVVPDPGIPPEAA